jgi:nitroreductase
LAARLMPVVASAAGRQRGGTMAAMNQPKAPEPSVSAAQAAVDEAITSRRSLRAFLPTPVPQSVIEDILRVAARAPSGTNTQPWKVTVLTGQAKTALSDKILAVHRDPDARAQCKDEYDYYPSQWMSPFVDRRRKVGWDLYSLLGIGKADKERMNAQHERNYTFFDAPVALMFSIHRVMQQGSWLDYGMFLQSIMIAARGRGLDTCPQAAFTPFHQVISEHIGLPAEEMLVCGMSLGYADPDALVNTLVTQREPVAGFTRFMD